MADYCMTVQSYFHKSQENTLQERNIKLILPFHPYQIQFKFKPHHNMFSFSPTLAKMLHCTRSNYLTKGLHSTGKARQEFAQHLLLQCCHLHAIVRQQFVHSIQYLFQVYEVWYHLSKKIPSGDTVSYNVVQLVGLLENKTFTHMVGAPLNMHLDIHCFRWTAK